MSNNKNATERKKGLLTLEFVRPTEAAAISAARAKGYGDKKHADQLATQAMREVFNEIDIDGTVVIGEGELDEMGKDAMLYRGEKVGTGNGPKVSIAVDPLDGTSICADGMAGAISTLAISKDDGEKCGLFGSPEMYMWKYAVGPKAKGQISFDKPLSQNIYDVARALGKQPNEMTVVMLKRTRHDPLRDEIRSTGAKISFITAGDVYPAVATAFPNSGIDMLVGAGGAPEGVLAAAALKCLGGDMCGRLDPALTVKEMTKKYNFGQVSEEMMTLDDLVPGDDVMFAMTAITDTSMLRGVYFEGDGKVCTHTMILRKKTGTVRIIWAQRDIATQHKWSRYAK